jgi:hypothetical protein
MAENTPVYTARFFPILPQGEVKAFHVPVQWWAYDNDRLGARGDAKLRKANILAKGVDAAQAKKLVVREWGGQATIGTPVEVS